MRPRDLGPTQIRTILLRRCRSRTRISRTMRPRHPCPPSSAPPNRSRGTARTARWARATTPINRQTRRIVRLRPLSVLVSITYVSGREERQKHRSGTRFERRYSCTNHTPCNQTPLKRVFRRGQLDSGTCRYVCISPVFFSLSRSLQQEYFPKPLFLNICTIEHTFFVPKS